MREVKTIKPRAKITPEEKQTFASEQNDPGIGIPHVTEEELEHLPTDTQAKVRESREVFSRNHEEWRSLGDDEETREDVLRRK